MYMYGAAICPHITAFTHLLSGCCAVEGDILLTYTCIFVYNPESLTAQRDPVIHTFVRQQSCIVVVSYYTPSLQPYSQGSETHFVIFLEGEEVREEASE